MEYVVYFDISQSGYRAGEIFLTPLLMGVFGAMFFAFRKQLFDFSKKITPSYLWWESAQKAMWSDKFFYVFFGGLFFWVTTVSFTTFLEYKTASEDLLLGRAEVIEGIINKYEAGTNVRGNAWDTFCVEDKCFEISDYRITSGYQQMQINGGPLKQDLPVRIFYVGDVIARLEIGKPD